MPKNVYTNKDLEKFNPREEYAPTDLDAYRYEPPLQEPSVEALLRQARGTLDRANKLAEETGSADIATIPQRMNALVQAPKIAHTNNPVRDATDAMGASAAPFGTMSLGLLGASLFPGAAPLTLPLAGITGGIAGAAALPGALRKLIAPESDESRTQGAIETGLSVLPLAADARAVLQAGKAASAARPVLSQAGQASASRKLAREMSSGGFADDVVTRTTGVSPKAARSFSTEVPYASRQPAQSLSAQLALAREVAAESGDDLASVIARMPASSKQADARVPMMMLARSNPAARQAEALRSVDVAQAAHTRRAMQGADDMIIDRALEARLSGVPESQVGLFRDPDVAAFREVGINTARSGPLRGLRPEQFGGDRTTGYKGYPGWEADMAQFIGSKHPLPAGHTYPDYVPGNTPAGDEEVLQRLVALMFGGSR